MKEQKTALINAMYERIVANEKSMEQFKKEFSVDDKTFEKMVKKFLDMWLDSPEIVMMFSEMLGIYAASEEERNEEDQDYLG